METECSLPVAQKAANCPYRARSNRHPPNQFL